MQNMMPKMKSNSKGGNFRWSNLNRHLEPKERFYFGTQLRMRELRETLETRPPSARPLWEESGQAVT
ncbi:MAG: hypothetical protein COV67_08560 [Nitrospinae bacterium CG11_big_fil_rev_8_21_14_0_20_56_8]|nr:MAG: hypothetical protein COV67_08560 [Nitrospinae bacterium CG11_big_fil_rev_8_21_14_0_20_56_8]